MSVQIHRLGNRVALYLRAMDSRGEYSEPGVTFYFTGEQAREISDVLHQFAVSIDNVPFTESTLGTFQFDYHGSRYHD